jgi:hypothetical protein
VFDAVFADEVHLVAFDGVEYKKEAVSEAKSRHILASVLLHYYGNNKSQKPAQQEIGLKP